MEESALTTKLNAAKAAGRLGLIPFLPAGYPTKERFWDEIAALDAAGADVIEIGVPFSDPVADGPVVEEASLSCLEQGVCLSWILTELKARRAGFQAEFVLMGYLNPLLAYGMSKFCKDAVDAGVAGVIIADMPLEESEEIRDTMEIFGLDMVYLVGLNTPAERLEAYAEVAKGFLYFVSVLGTTGVRDCLPPEVLGKLKEVRERFEIPVALGFGIKEPAQTKPFAGLIDAVVFGSALIRHIKDGGSAASFMEVWK